MRTLWNLATCGGLVLEGCAVQLLGCLDVIRRGLQVDQAAQPLGLTTSERISIVRQCHNGMNRSKT